MRQVGVILALAVAASCSPPPTTGCEPSPEVSFPELDQLSRAHDPSDAVGEYVSSVPARLRLAGNLAGPAELVARDGTKGQVWIYRTAHPSMFITLHAERVGNGVSKSFEIFRLGTSTPPVNMPGGGIGYIYGATQREPILDAGCWRIRPSFDQAVEALVLEVR